MVVHDDHVGGGRGRQRRGFDHRAGPADHLHVLLTVQQKSQALRDELVVLDDDDPDAVAVDISSEPKHARGPVQLAHLKTQAGSAATSGGSTTRAMRKRSRNVPSQPLISSRLSIAGTYTSRDGEGAWSSLRTLAPCPVVAPRLFERTLLPPAAM